MFNREHVLPQSFGKYPDNFVLRELVCKACSDHFSRELDLRLARNSAEGLERFHHDLVSTKNRRSIGLSIEVRYRGGKLDGAILEWHIEPDSKTLTVRPVPQIGFSTSPDGPFEWHRADELPSGDALRARGFSPESTYFLTGSLPEDEAVRHIQGLGYSLLEGPKQCDAGIGLDGAVPVMISGVIDEVIMRAVAKIAFDYFCFHYPSIASMDQFDPIRRYVRYGEKPTSSPVAVLQKSILGGVAEGRQLLVHAITVAWDGIAQRVVAQVSLFSWIQYRIVLTSEPFAIAPLCIDSGHLFDPLNRQIVPLTRFAANTVPIPMAEQPNRRERGHGRCN